MTCRFGRAIGWIVLWAACETPAPPFPELEPWRPGMSAPEALAPDERALWEDAAKFVKELRESDACYEDAALETYLATVVAELAPPRNDFGPKLRVLVHEDVESNAMSLPDGTVVVALPLLARFTNEAQLAFVLGHEIAHIRARHALRSKRYDALTGSYVDRMRQSRMLEAEADREAIRLMTAAGYDPAEAEPALQHVVESMPGPQSSVRAWNSHDDLPRRIATLDAAMRKQRSKTREGRAETYSAALDPHRLEAARLELAAGRFEAAESIVERHLERKPDSGPAHALRARILLEQEPADRPSAVVVAELERAVELGPEDADSLRLLGLVLRDTGAAERSKAMFRRYLDARPDAFDRKLIERYVETSGR